MDADFRGSLRHDAESAPACPVELPLHTPLENSHPQPVPSACSSAFLRPSANKLHPHFTLPLLSLHSLFIFFKILS